MKKHLIVLIAVAFFFASIASLIYTVNEINTNGHYLDLTAFYPCNDITKNENNVWTLHFDGSDEYTSSDYYPMLNYNYKDDSIDRLLNNHRITKSDFTQETINELHFTVKKDGYSFWYVRATLMKYEYCIEASQMGSLPEYAYCIEASQKDSLPEYAYCIDFKIGDYRFGFYGFDACTGEMAEFRNTYKNADECIKAIKKFEPIAKKAIAEAESRYNTMLLIIAVSAVCLIASAAVLVLCFIKRKNAHIKAENAQ